MQITEVKIYPTKSRDGKLKAFATMTFDDWFVVRNIKVIEGNNGCFVAMPSRKAVESCSQCGNKNELGSHYCNQCGKKLPPYAEDDNGKKMHMDIAHPITQECRIYIQDKILEAYDQGSGLSGTDADEMAVRQERGMERAGAKEPKGSDIGDAPSIEERDIEL